MTHPYGQIVDLETAGDHQIRKYRRNGKLQSCEPCRKSKLRCDHTTPSCGRCVKRRRIDQCVYHPSPLTQVSRDNFLNPLAKTPINAMYSDQGSTDFLSGSWRSCGQFWYNSSGPLYCDQIIRFKLLKIVKFLTDSGMAEPAWKPLTNHLARYFVA
jgi:Fungal Zn(2)-Cys(6) binuclear cluster domain